MLLKSDTVHNAWAATQRTVGVKLTIKGTEYDASDITSLTFDSGAMNGEALTLGSTYQNTIKVVLSRLIEGLTLTDEIAPELGIKLPDGTWDYTPLGVFVIDAEVQQDRNNNTTTVSASDRMCMLGGTYKSKLTYPAAINDIAVEIANLAAVKLNEDDFARLPTDKVASFGKVTYRDAIGFVAQFAGGFATFDRKGLLDIRQLVDPNFDVAPSQYQSKGLTKNEALYRIGGITCTVTTTTTDDSGNETQDTTTLQSGSTAGTQITISNPGMTQDLLDGLYEQLQDLNFYPFSLSWFGDPNLEAGDWIEVQDTAGNTFKTPNLLYSLTFSGGVTATSKADTTVSASASFVYKGQLNQIVENIRQYLNASGQQVSEGLDEPPHPKAGDVWFKKSGPDTYIMMYKVDPETGIGSWVEEVSTKGVSGLDAELKAAKAKLNADILAAQANLTTAQKDVAALQTKLAANDATQAQLSKDLSANSTILAQAQADIVANTQSLSDLDTKLKVNDDIQAQLKNDLAANTKVQDQLTTDLAANTKLITTNKESVDAALVTVNKTLSQATADTATAVKNADLAVTNAQSAVDASGLATKTAQAASDAAIAAKNLATSTAANFATVQSQAKSAASDASTALSNANNAMGQASTAIGTASDAITQAKSALSKANSVQASMQPAITAAVDTAKGELTASIQTVQNGLDGLHFTARNFVISQKIRKHQINEKTGNSRSLQFTAHRQFDGVYISTTGFKPSTPYVMSFDALLTGGSGDPYIGGDKAPFAVANSVIVDGAIRNVSWSDGVGGIADGKVHHFEVHLVTNSSPESDARGFFIQPIRNSGPTNWNITIENWMINEGTKAAEYQPAPEDIQEQITTNSVKIAANSKEIVLKANQSVVDIISKQVETNTSQLKLTATAASLEVTSKKVDTLSQTVTDQGAKLDLTATSAQLKVTDNKVDELNKTVSENSAQLKLTATSAALETQSKRVDTISGAVDQNTADIIAANGAIELKANSSTVDALEGTVKQQGIDLKAAQGQLALKITQNDLTKGLDGYATQTWASQQITASATGLETKLSSVTTKLDNLKIGSRNYAASDKIWPWSGVTIVGTTKSFRITSTRNSNPWNGWAFWSNDFENGQTYVCSFDFHILTGYIFGFGGDAGGLSSATLTIDNGAPISMGTFASGFSFRPTEASGKHHFVLTFIPNLSSTSSKFIYFQPNRILDSSWPPFSADVTDFMVAKDREASWSPAPEDSATYTDAKVADLKLTVDGLSATFAKQKDLEEATANFKVTADGLDFVTAVTGKKGEKVTQVIADVHQIQTTMTGADGYTTRLQTLEGFQSTATNDIKGIKSQQTLMANQWTSIVGDLGNMVRGGDFEDQAGDQPSPYWSANGANVRANFSQNSVNMSATCLQINGLADGNRDVMFNDYFKVTQNKNYKGTFKVRWNSVNQNGTVILYAIEYDAGKKLIRAKSIINDTAGGTSGHNWMQFSGNYTPSADCAYIRLDVTYNGALGTSPIWVDDIDFREDLANNSQITQLQDNIDLRVKVDNKVTAALSLSADGGGTVTIRGASLYVTASSHFDDASIQSAAIANLDAEKITSGSISADRLATTKLNADNITSGSISADRLATTKLNASNITSGSINAGLITTGVLSADMILGGTFDASKMTVKNIDAGSITSGSIATALLASTQINADNITSGSIAAARIATTALSATNIISGTLDVGKLTVKNLSADMIASGTIDASKITVKNLSASNIIGGELDALLVNVKNLNADNIITGTLNAGLLNVIGLNASAISAGTITGANLAINLGTGEVMFQKGSIKSADGHLNIDVNNGTFVQSDGTKGMMFAKGNLYLSSSSWWDGLSNPDAAPKPDYGFIGYTDTVLTARGFGVIGRDALTLGLNDNDNPGMEYTSSPVITMDRSNVTLDFAGELATIQAGREFTITTNPFYNSGQTPGIEIGSNVGRSGIGDRVFIDGSYVYIPSAYSRTASGSANLIVAADGALVRTSSATKYKSNIERFRNTDMGEALLNLPQAHWYNKGDMQRYVDDPQHYSMPELDYGMIAEDLAAAGLEDLVVRGDDGQLEDIRYDRIAPALLPLLAKMKQEIEELKSAAKSA